MLFAYNIHTHTHPVSAHTTLLAAAKPTKGFGPAHGKQAAAPASTPLAIVLNWREICYAAASNLISAAVLSDGTVTCFLVFSPIGFIFTEGF
jgi:hypothetical protein